MTKRPYLYYYNLKKLKAGPYCNSNHISLSTSSYLNTKINQIILRYHTIHPRLWKLVLKKPNWSSTVTVRKCTTSTMSNNNGNDIYLEPEKFFFCLPGISPIYCLAWKSRHTTERYLVFDGWTTNSGEITNTKMAKIWLVTQTILSFNYTASKTGSIQRCSNSMQWSSIRFLKKWKNSIK